MIIFCKTMTNIHQTEASIKEKGTFYQETVLYDHGNDINYAGINLNVAEIELIPSSINLHDPAIHPTDSAKSLNNCEMTCPKIA